MKESRFFSTSTQILFFFVFVTIFLSTPSKSIEISYDVRPVTFSFDELSTGTEGNCASEKENENDVDQQHWGTEKLAIFIRFAQVNKPRMLSFNASQIQASVLYSLRESIRHLPPNVQVEIYSIYDTDSLKQAGRLEDVMDMVECIFRDVMIPSIHSIHASTEQKQESKQCQQQQQQHRLNHVISHISGNRETNLVQYQLALEEDLGEAILYFVEEDYLHAPTALAELVQIIQFNGTAFASGFDHPDRYWEGSPHGKFRQGRRDRNDGASFLVAQPSKLSRHWRTAESTTMTFAARRSLFFETASVFTSLAPQDNPIWEILDREYKLWLFTPLPCLVTHMHYQQCFYSLDWDGFALAALENARQMKCWRGQ